MAVYSRKGKSWVKGLPPPPHTARNPPRLLLPGPKREFSERSSSDLPVHGARLAAGAIEFILPNNRHISAAEIGYGHATTAYIGSDGWVYAVSNMAANDRSKELLTDFNLSLDMAIHDRRPPWVNHVPYIEAVGKLADRINDRQQAGATVHRMPLYYQTNKENRGIAIEYEFATTNIGHTPTRKERAERQLRFLGVASKDGNVPASVYKATEMLLTYLWSRSKFGVVLDASSDNFAQDAAGRLVLLDLIFEPDRRANILS